MCILLTLPMCLVSKPNDVYADDVVIATGGQNGLFGKTTGSALCDGYAAGKLFMQGAKLNLNYSSWPKKDLLNHIITYFKKFFRFHLKSEARV